MNQNKYSYLMNLNKNLITFCKYEANNFNTQCWIIKKNCFSKLDTLYVFKNNFEDQVKSIKITSKGLKKNNMINFFENDTFLVYLKVKNTWGL